MRRASAPLIALLIMLLAGCSTTNEVVGKGPFQKRKYRPGWHVDLGRPAPMDHRARHAQEAAPIATLSPRIPTPSASPEAALHTAPPIRVPSIVPTSRSPEQHSVPALRQEDAQAVARPITAPDDQPQATDTANGPRRWNRMALVSGVFLLLSLLVIALGSGGVLLYLLFFAFLTGIIGLLLAIKHNERGRGIAIAAIAVPAVLIALIIVALNAAWG